MQVFPKVEFWTKMKISDSVVVESASSSSFDLCKVDYNAIDASFFQGL